MKPIKYCIFDFDGTLANSQFFWQTVVLRILQERGCPATEEDFELCITLSAEERWAHFARRFSLTDADRPSVEEIYAHIDRFYQTEVQWKEGVTEFLSWLKERGIVTALFSATPLEVLRHGVEKLGGTSYFDYIFSTSQSGVGKSKPESYRYCLDAMGATPEETVMFEDAAYSMKTAKAMGIYVVAVYEACKMTEIETIRAHSDLYVNTLAECKQKFLEA